MKKILLIFSLSLLSIGLIACGDSENVSSESNKKESDEIKQQDDKEKKKDVKAKDDKEKKKKLDDTVLKTDKYTYKIKNTEQVESKFDDKQILALEVEFTNNSDSAKSPWIASATSMKANQETDSTVELLSGGSVYLPDDYKPELVKMGNTKVKPGSTVDTIIAFEIKTPGEPVHLIDFNFTDKPKKFERIIETE